MTCWAINYHNNHNNKKGNNIDNSTINNNNDSNNNILAIPIVDDVIPIAIVRMIFTLLIIYPVTHHREQ